LEEAVEEYLVGAVSDPFMVQVYAIRPDKRRVITAVTYVDGNGRRGRPRSTGTSSRPLRR